MLQRRTSCPRHYDVLEVAVDENLAGDVLAERVGENDPSFPVVPPDSDERFGHRLILGVKFTAAPQQLTFCRPARSAGAGRCDSCSKLSSVLSRLVA